MTRRHGCRSKSDINTQSKPKPSNKLNPNTGRGEEISELLGDPRKNESRSFIRRSLKKAIREGKKIHTMEELNACIPRTRK